MENNSESKIVIGLVGRICAGKGTVSDRLAETYGAAVLSFSDPMREVLRVLHMDVSRPNLQKISLAVRSQFGENAFSYVIKGKALEQKEKIIVLDPIRRPADTDAFEKGSLIMIAVTRDEEARYQSMLERNREKNDSDVTIEKFRELDTAETEQYIDDLVAKADHVIENNGTMEELWGKVDALMSQIVKK